MPKNFIIEWEDLEFRHRPKDARWFWYAFAIIMLILIISVILKNILFVFFIIIGSVVLFFTVLQKPKEITYGIARQGIVIDKTLFPFHTIESFWIREEEEEDMLVLKSEKRLMPHILIPLGKTDSDDVRHVLLEYLKEEPLEKLLVESFAEYIGLH